MILGITDRRVFVCREEFIAYALMSIKAGIGGRISKVIETINHIKRKTV